MTPLFNVSLIDDFETVISDNDILCIQTNNFSILSLVKLLNNTRDRINEIRILLTSESISDYWDKDFECSVEDRIKNWDSITAISEFFNDKKVVIRRCNSIPYSLITTKRTSYFIGTTTIDAALFGTTSGHRSPIPVMKGNTPEDSDFRKSFSKLWNSSKDYSDSFREKMRAVFSLSTKQFYFYLLNKFFDKRESAELGDSTQINIDSFCTSQIYKTLFPFQKDAVFEIVNRLNRYGMCILADSVGLGKTYTALGVMKYYMTQNRKINILLLCPKKLENNWKVNISNIKENIFRDDQFRYDVFFHTDLNREGKSNGVDLSHVIWSDYDLVVIDESHNFRSGISRQRGSDGNQQENRYSFLLQEIIKKGCKTKVLMLSATPVNNKFSDLHNQIKLISDSEPENLLKDTKIQNLDTVFKTADSRFKNWSRNAPDHSTSSLLKELDSKFIDLISKATIARSRIHIEKFYDTNQIGHFPKRNTPIGISRYENSQIRYEEIAKKLSDEMMMAVYMPSRYIKQEYYKDYPDLFKKGRNGNLTSKGREYGVAKLMNINLLKRLESSVFSFSKTLDKIVSKSSEQIKNIEIASATSNEIQQAIIEDTTEYDNEDYISPENLIPAKVPIKVEHIDCERWISDIQKDLGIMNYIKNSIKNELSMCYDSKLIKLKESISNKIESTENKKILIFTAFADTAEYIFDKLEGWIQYKFQLQTGLVTGDGCKSTLDIGNDFNKILTLFSPVSKHRDAVYPDEKREIDILIATDCISEGQNLQDCDYLVNYDIHWNPVRLIQRFGRIDRIGSQNETIQLVNMWPDIRLDQYINLKTKVETKMIATVLPGTANNDVLTESEEDNRDTQVQDIQNKIIEQQLDAINKGNLSIGNTLEIDDYNLAGYRRELFQNKEKIEIPLLPNGLPVEITTKNKKQDEIIFILKDEETDDGKIVEKRKTNPLFPYQLVSSVGNIDENNTLRILDILRNMETVKILSKDSVPEQQDVLWQWNSVQQQINNADNTDTSNSLFALGSTVSNRNRKDIISYIIVR